jgi:hypothetical protein
MPSLLRHAFYILFQPMMNDPSEWPSKYEQYRDGVVVMYPFNVTADTVRQAKSDLNATVLMYFDSQDVAIETGGMCVNPYKPACSKPARPCSTGRVMCCSSYDCEVFAPNSTAKLCPPSEFSAALGKVFEPSWAINLLPNHSGSIVEVPTPICYYYFGPLYAPSAKSVGVLTDFVTDWVKQMGFDGLCESSRLHTGMPQTELDRCVHYDALA